MSGSPTRPEAVASPPADARRRPAAIPFAVWAVLLGALAGVQAGFGGHLLPVLVQAGAAALSGTIALGIVLAARTERLWLAGRRTIPELSLAGVLATVSLATMLIGASVGGWLIIGGGLGLAAAAAGLVRELRAERRAGRHDYPALSGEPDQCGEGPG